MEEIASFGINLAAYAVVGFVICALFTKDDPGLARRLDYILGVGSVLIFIFHQEAGLMMLIAVLTIAYLREP